jgi:hypothetical protein
MNILELFAEKYLSNYDVELPLNNGIISNGHCYHHALEYANGDLTVAFSNDLNKNADIKECILASRVDVTNLYIGLVTYIITLLTQAVLIEKHIKKKRELENTIKGYRIDIESMNDFKENTAYSEDKIIKQGVIFKQKAICILMPYKNQPDKLTFRILTNDDIGTLFNVNNILFLINLSTTKKDKKSGKLYPIGEHFITFRNNKCRRVIPTRDFIDIINHIIRTGFGFNEQPILRIDADIDGIMEINFNIQDIDIDRQIIGDPRLIKLKLLPEIMPVVLPEKPETNSARNAINQVANYERQQLKENNQSKNKSSPHSTVSSITNPSYNQSPEGVSLSESMKADERQFAKQVSLNNETPENERGIIKQPLEKFPLGSRLNGILPFNPPLGSRLNGNLPWGKKTRNNNSTNSSASRNRYRRDTGLVAVKKQGKTKKAKPPT